MAKPPPKPGHAKRPRTALDIPYEPGDLIPKPEVVEREGDSAWAMFNALSEQHDAKFADTVPGGSDVPFVHSTQDPAYAPTKPMGLPSTRDSDQPAPIPKLTLDIVMVEARRKNRVCPRPRRWQQLYDMLPAKQMVNGMPHPPAPVIGPAWNAVAPLGKRLCFREHLEWAERHGMLVEVFALIQSLTEEEWFHMEDA